MVAAEREERREHGAEDSERQRALHVHRDLTEIVARVARPGASLLACVIIRRAPCIDWLFAVDICFRCKSSLSSPPDSPRPDSPASRSPTSTAVR